MFSRLKIKNTLTDNQGVSLIELSVAMTIFVLLVLLITATFQGIIKRQNVITTNQDLQENLRFAMEVISKEIRMAGYFADIAAGCDNRDKNDGGYKVYNIINDKNANKAQNKTTQGDTLFFKNKNNECVKYYLDNGQLMINRKTATTDISQPITPSDITINYLQFRITDNKKNNPQNSNQPKVTINMTLEKENFSQTVQTTISSRFYE